VIPAPNPNEPYLPASPMPSTPSSPTSVPPNPTASGDPPRSPRQRTVAKVIRRKRGPKSKRQVSHRELLMRKYGVTSEQLADQPQVTPLLRQNGVKPARLVEVLRCDTESESLAFIKFWDSLPNGDRRDIGLEMAALAAQITPRRLWELYHGATLMQAKESVAVMMAEALPAIMKRALSRAKTVKGDRDRERIMKAARILPTPKGSTTVIYPGLPPAASEDDATDVASGDLESADDFLMKAAKAMHGKGLPPGPALDEVELIDADEVDE
jgi:hypothetical protein